MAGSGDSFTCKYCGKEFDSKRALLGHQNLQCDQREEDGHLDEPALRSDSTPEKPAEKRRKETTIGFLKIVQEADETPQLYLSMGEVEIPVHADFQMKKEGGEAVLEARSPHVDMESDEPGGATGTPLLPAESGAVTGRTAPSGPAARGDGGKTAEPAPSAGTETQEASQSPLPEQVLEEAQKADTDEPELPDNTLDEDNLAHLTEFLPDSHETAQQTQDAPHIPDGLRQKLIEEYDIDPERLQDLTEKDLEKLSRRLSKRERLKKEIGSEYDVRGADVSGKSLEQLQTMREQLGEKDELVEQLAELYDIDEDDLEGVSYQSLKELKERLEKRDDIKQELINTYGVDEEKLVGKSLDELKGLREKKKNEQQLRDELTEEYGVGEDELADHSIDELRKAMDELEEERDELIADLEEHGRDPDELKKMTNPELREQHEQLQRRQELEQTLIDEYGLGRRDIKDLSLEELEEMKDDLEQKQDLISTIQDEHGVDRDLWDKELDELQELKERLEETRELREYLIEEHDISSERLADKDLEELKDLRTHLEEIEHHKEEVLTEYGIDGEEQPSEEEQARQKAAKMQNLKQMADDESGDEPGTEDIGVEVEKGQNLIKDLGLADIKGDYGQQDDEEEEEDEDEEESGGLRSRIPFLNRGSGGSGASGSPKDAALDNLERAKQIDDYDQATVIIAHTLKQFVELKMDVNREMTYMEFVRAADEDEVLAEQLSDDELETLEDFFRKIHFQQYKGERRVDLDEAYEIAEATIKSLS